MRRVARRRSYYILEYILHRTVLAYGFRRMETRVRKAGCLSGADAPEPRSYRPTDTDTRGGHRWMETTST